ncbi:MAG: hypothetical protein ACRD9S_14530 [Pyrinomonadaceae bacterium]
MDRRKLFTGSAGVPPVMSAQREPNGGELTFCEIVAPCGAQAGGTPALPVKSLRGEHGRYRFRFCICVGQMRNPGSMG